MESTSIHPTLLGQGTKCPQQEEELIGQFPYLVHINTVPCSQHSHKHTNKIGM